MKMNRRNSITKMILAALLLLWASTAVVAEEKKAMSQVELKQWHEQLNKARDVFAGILPDPITGMEFVWVPGGCYQMGCGSWTDDCAPNEKPVHEVCLDGFWIGKYEVTQGQWEKVMGNNPSKSKRGKNYPVENVSWNDCQTFIDQLNNKVGGQRKYHLPTEAEWEYACRSGGKAEKYAGGSDVGQVAWYKENSGNKPHEAGGKAPNGLGIYNMSGNVWECCEDWLGDYPSGSVRNPTGPSSGSNRIIRGGGCGNDARNCRSVLRVGYSPGNRNWDVGFRLAFSSGQ